MFFILLSLEIQGSAGSQNEGTIVGRGAVNTRGAVRHKVKKDLNHLEDYLAVLLLEAQPMGSLKTDSKGKKKYAFSQFF
jgi:hypothetical protein